VVFIGVTVPELPENQQFDREIEYHLVRVSRKEVSWFSAHQGCNPKLTNTWSLSRLPEIQDELVNTIRETEAKISELPRAPSIDPVSEVLQALNVFSRELSRRLEGTPDKDGLLQTIRPHQQGFRRAIRGTAPKFVPLEMKKAGKKIPKAKFLQDEEGEEEEEEEEVNDSSDGGPAGLGSKRKLDVFLVTGDHQTHPAKKTMRVDQKIYIDEVMKRAQRYALLP
jgi:hypothetical protein